MIVNATTPRCRIPAAVACAFVLLLHPNPATASLAWTQRATLEAAGHYYRGAVVKDGMIYVFRYDRMYRYDPALDSWTTLSKAPVALPDSTIAGIGDAVYMVGGSLDGSSVFLSNVLTYRISTDSWTTGPPTDPAFPARHSAVLNGLIYATGDIRYTQTAGGEIRSFNPASGLWTRRAPLTVPRDDACLVVVSGTLYAMGGEMLSPPWSYLGTVEAYDSVGDTWSVKTPMPTARSAVGLAAASGRVYAVGGNAGPFLDTVEVYNSLNDSWAPDTSLPWPIFWPAPAVVDCRLYVIAGMYGNSGSVYVADIPESSGLAVAAWGPPTASVGQVFTVNAGVSNPWCNFPATGIAVTITASGSELISAILGPIPLGPLDLEMDSSTVFRWTTTATGAGEVAFTVTVTGTDSGFGGPLTAVATGSVIVQAPAGLSASLSAPVGGCVGWPLTVTMDVLNTGEANALGVAGSATLMVEGTSSADLVSRAVGVTALTGGSGATFTWTYVPSTTGTLAFTGTATGTDGNAGWPIGTGPIVSGTVLIVAPAVLAAAGSGPSGPPVPAGQWLTVALAVTNTGGLPADLAMPSVTVWPAGAPVVIEQGPSSGLTLGVGSGTAFSWTWSVSGWGRAAFTMSVTGTDACYGFTAGKTVAVDLGTPAALAVSAITVSPDPVCEATLVSVSLTVTNTGQVPATNVTGVAAAVAGSAAPVSSPASVGSLAGGGSATMTWTYSATALGTLEFAATLTGLDARSGAPVTAAPVGSNTITVTPRAALAASASASVSGTVFSGGWVDVMLTVTNTGVNGATGVSPRWIQSGGTAAAALIGGPVPAGPLGLGPGATATFTWTLSASGSGRANLVLSATGYSCAAVVSGSAPVTILVRRPAVLAIQSLQLAPATVVMGSTVYATLVVRNTGEVGFTVTAVGRSVAGGVLWPSLDALSLPVGLSPGTAASFTWSQLTRTFCGTGGAGAWVAGWEDVSGRWLSANGMSNLVSVTGLPAALSLAAAAGQANEGTAVGLAATVVDACGQGVGGSIVSFAVVEGGGWLSSMNAMTDGGGVARVSWTVGSTPVMNRAQATLASAGLSATAEVEAVNPLQLAGTGAGLSANVINPWNGEVVIARIRPLTNAPIAVKVYTASGKLVRTIRSVLSVGNGQWQAVWDGKTEDEFPVARGVYIVRVTGGGLNDTLKVVVR
jgi:hypothetical protein